MSRRLPPKVESNIYLHRKRSFISLNKICKGNLPKIERLDLLPYHRLGEPKYRRLAVDYSLQDAQTQPKAVVDRLKTIVEDYGLRVRIGG